MRRATYPLVTGAAASVVIVLGLLSASALPVGAAPEPASTKDVPVSVIIPAPSTPPAPPAPQPSSSTGGGSSPAAVTPGGTTCVPVVGDKPPAPSATPSDKAGKLTLDREKVAVEQWLVAKGSGYSAGEYVQVVLYPGAAAITERYKADAGGNIVARIRIPVDTRAGDHTVEATGWTSCAANKAEFDVVTDLDIAAFPYLWWVLIVGGVLLVAIVVTLLYFRNSIRQWFGGGLTATEPVT